MHVIDPTTLTDRQAEVLAYWAEYTHREQSPPTYREVCDAFGWRSKMSCTAHLRALERKGYVERSGASRRRYRLTPLGLQWRSSPKAVAS